MEEDIMEKSATDLYTLQTRLKNAVEGTFPGKVWVNAEVSAIKARAGGHCYMELSQSGPSGLLAKASAIIWSSKFRFLAPYFESVAGIPLQEGINVLVQVQVNFSQLYGLSLIIDDIDPGYTLGDKERAKQVKSARAGLCFGSVFKLREDSPCGNLKPTRAMCFIFAWRIPTHEYKAACIKSPMKRRPNFALQQRVFKSPTAWNSKSNSIFPTFRKQNLSLSTPFKRFEIQKAPVGKAECMQATMTM